MEESVPFVVSRLADFLEELTTDVDLVLLVSDVFEILLPFLLVAVVHQVKDDDTGNGASDSSSQSLKGDDVMP